MGGEWLRPLHGLLGQSEQRLGERLVFLRAPAAVSRPHRVGGLPRDPGRNRAPPLGGPSTTQATRVLEQTGGGPTSVRTGRREKLRFRVRPRPPEEVLLARALPGPAPASPVPARGPVPPRREVPVPRVFRRQASRPRLSRSEAGARPWPTPRTCGPRRGTRDGSACRPARSSSPDRR